jgi:dihydroorotate dehydrogenase
VVKSVADVEAMAATGVGWIEDGSVTLEPRIGNGASGERTYCYDAASGETGNSLGMPNSGIMVASRDMAEKISIARKLNKKFVQNVAPVGPEPALETQELVARAYQSGAEAVLLNAGCPNVISEDGDRHETLSQNVDELEMVLDGLITVTDRFRPIFLRLSPQPDRTATRRILRPVLASGVVSAVFVPNTWPGYRPVDASGEPILEVPGGIGGRSGPACAPAAAEQTRWAAEILRHTKLDVVSSAGIMNAAELRRRLDLGALAAAGTTFYYESADWRADTDCLLRELAGE